MTATEFENSLIPPINTFAFQLFGRISERIRDHNIFISPFSITYVLVLLNLGSNGTTRQEIAQVLGIQNVELNEANTAYAHLQQQLTKYGEQEVLSLANSLWVKQQEQLKPEFIRSSKDLFNAEVLNVNFANSNAANIINEWVNQKTNQKIPEIVCQEDLNSDTIVMLLNAIYFNGRWKNSFNKSATRKADFTLANSQLKSVEMMNQSGEYEYFQDEDYQAIVIPYQNDTISIVILLPDRQSSLDTLQQQLDNNLWQQWQNQFSRQQIYLSLPRFKIEYEDSLMEDLQGLGLGIALGRSANYQNMCNEQIAISDIKHKTFMEVNEEGTEAAATTGVLMQRILGRTSSMVIDRPFFCVIKHNRTGVILFMGAIWEPN
jgi:serine protease inhibitor